MHSNLYNYVVAFTLIQLYNVYNIFFILTILASCEGNDIICVVMKLAQVEFMCKLSINIIPSLE